MVLISTSTIVLQDNTSSAIFPAHDELGEFTATLVHQPILMSITKVQLKKKNRLPSYGW